MKPSRELFKLIKSLSRSEKRFFKLSSSLQSGNKNYLKLFDAIDKQEEYDEEAIKKQFKKENFIKHLPSEKNHLYKLLMKSLRSYHADNSISSLLKQELKNIEILYRKRLFPECNKFLSKAKKMAYEHEKFYFLSELISWEKQLLQEAYESGEFSLSLDNLVAEERDIIEKLKNLTEYHILYAKMHFAFKSGGFVRSSKEKGLVDEIIQDPLIMDENNALSKRAASLCYYIRGFCHGAHLDSESMFLDFTKVKDILDENPKVKEDVPLRYIHTLNNLMNYYTDKGDFESSMNMISRMRELSKEPGFRTHNRMVRLFVASYNGELNLLDRQGKHHKVKDIIGEIQKGLDEYQDTISKEQELVLNFNLAYLFFGAGEYNTALGWLNKILNDNEAKLRQDIYSYARLFNLVLHYELGNYDLLEYIIKSTFRYLSKRERYLEAESLILKYLKRVPKITDQEKLTEQFRSLKSDLNAIFEKDEREKVVLEYFDFLAWLDSKLEDISFSEAVRKRNQKTISD